MISIEDEYRKIGKAVIDECMVRADEECISITLRVVQFCEKLYIRMEDMVEPISIWGFRDLSDIAIANRQQGARERAEVLPNKIRDASVPEEPPQVVIVK